MSGRRWLASSTLLLVMVLLLVGAVALSSYVYSTKPGKMTTVVTATVPSATPTIPSIYDPAWTRAPDAIQGAPISVMGLAGHLYSCGDPQHSGIVRYSAANDGGFNWSAPVAIGAGFSCMLAVNPDNAQQIAAVLMPCDLGACLAGPPTANLLYRSIDGGATWQGATLPIGGTNWQFAPQIVWDNDALIVAVVPITPPATARHVLAISTNGAAFSWIDQSANLTLRAGSPGDVLRQILVSGNAVYIVIQEGVSIRQGIDGYQQRLVRSTDTGRTWAIVRLQNEGQDVRVLKIGQDGKTLLGIAGGELPLASTDGGQTWKAAPTFAQGTVGLLDMLPDGALIGAFLAPTKLPQYRLEAVNAGTWHTVSEQGPASIIAVTADANGHPLFAWGSYLDGPGHAVLLVYRIAR